MEAATHTIVKGSRPAASATESMRRKENDNFVFAGDANLMHRPAFWVGIFNVSDMEQRVERPWLHTQFFAAPNAERRPSAKIMIIPACEEGKEYGKPFIIPDVVQMPEERPGSWQIRTFGQDGRFLAQDAINPEDPRGSWKTVRPMGAGFLSNEGTNLYDFGCFWIAAPTVDELIPDADVLTAAHKRLEAKYNMLVTEANSFALQGATGIVQIGSLHRRAANYFGLDVDWNKRYTRKVPCQNCGEPLSPLAAVCTKCPAVQNWEKAIALGLRTIQQAMDAGVVPAAESAAQAETEKKPRGRKAKA